MDILISFKQYFREKAAPILKQAEKQKFILPFNDKIDIDSSLMNPDLNANLLLSNSRMKNNLTVRQIECCTLLLAGKTAKEISETLRLSQRTVEYYFGNIRTKLQCNNKAELIAKLTKIINP